MGRCLPFFFSAPVNKSVELGRLAEPSPGFDELANQCGPGNGTSHTGPLPALKVDFMCLFEPVFFMSRFLAFHPALLLTDSADSLRCPIAIPEHIPDYQC